MKKLLYLSLMTIVAIFACGIAFSRPLNQSTKGTPVSATIPPDIYKIIGNSCVDCHSKGGKKMAMSHVNFSEWDNYSAEKKAEKAADMVKMLNKGKMPPKLYRESHPENVPSSADIEAITKWAESLPKK